ncbi:hypothetical protein P153DRAFT_366273 [Dothidotthia symphoricarpi CBS 119687]|uniref:Uncharacterized protein n=1 Tax=Dothidotthia symphoricarpi CBS 119687 TaxID=1392245 RepID=A0A6A6AFP5_9PLEO|nr:uncharacterized protein P153DRAFT_366273 [Dothidotthia symphoricarpi CBS 119687]KAF2129764.1 hypothetical protein P153DRAFT_366273 [Dothidotthia symphoricarpi CBS 119687]
MLTAQRYHDPDMPDSDMPDPDMPGSEVRDLERELMDTLANHYGSNGEPLDGLFTLTRRMDIDDDDQLDVDRTILDFLVYKTLDSLFEWRRRSNPFESDLPSALTTMTVDWRTLLKHRHHGRRLDGQTAFRSKLLQFVLVFTHRLNHDKTWTNEEALQALRDQNKLRGDHWYHHTKQSPAVQQSFDTPKEFPLSDATLLNNRTRLASTLDMPVDRRRYISDVSGTPSLHCLLPLFMELSAARVDLDDDWLPTNDWYTLAGQFMLQAVIDEYLRNGAHGEDTFNTIFAFGCPGADQEGVLMTAMRTLFCNEDNTHKQNHDWTRIKRRFIDEILPQSPSQSTLQAIERARENNPYVTFEENLLAFLKNLHDSLVKPDLIQVEEGCININGRELSEAESREMISRMRL